MKALLLAAGRGTRISRHIDGKPKCTVSLDEKTSLIEYSVDLLRRKGVEDVTVALGYRGDVIRDLLAGRNIKFRENPFYDVTNSIASLWFAREELTGADRFIVMNGDVFLSEKALDVVLSEKRSPVMFYDVTRREEADYKFQVVGERIVKYGKELTLEETSGEYVGCAIFGDGFLDAFAGRLDELIREQQHSMWWENVLYSMAGERMVIARDIEGAFWGEVDYIEDYERIMQFYKGESRC
ncbi:MAG: phosphocholine cytidylyltransferase family protein [Rectinemataceae bacterium]|jgi:choline kinase